MKKFLLLFGFLCLVMSGAYAGGSNDTTGYYYDVESPLLVDVAQLDANSISIPDCSNSAGIVNLIDGDNSTVFHTFWDRATFSSSTLTEDSYKEYVSNLDTSKYKLNGIGWSNLQVTLYDPTQIIFITFVGRDNAKYCDFPNDIIVYATNDDALGASTLSTESSSWDMITELKDGMPSAGALAKYSSPAIDLGKAYKYLRFEMRNTATSDRGGTGVRTYARPEVTGMVWSLAEFQIYQGIKIEGYRTRLDSLVNAAANYTFAAGDDPGYYPTAKVAAYDSIYQEVLDQYVLNLTDAECKELYDKLYAALNDVINTGIVPLTDGYYNIVSAWNVFMNTQGVDKAWFYDSTQDALMWTSYDKRQPLQLFKLEKQADGNYSVQNVVSGRYLYHLSRNGVPVPFSETFESEQVFAPFVAKPYEFKIYSPDFDSQYNKYNTRQHNNGTGVTGQVAAWDSDIDGEATWLLKRVDGALLDSLLQVANRTKIDGELRTTLKEAQTLYDKCYDYNSIFTDAAQMTVNSQNPSEGSIAALLDGDMTTYFHSDWQSSFKSEMTSGTGWHNMQFALENAVDKVKFYYAGRINSSGYVDDPDHITIYGTNDETLAASTAAADSASWTEIADLTKPEYDFPEKNLNGSTYTSPVIDLGGSYKYLRFVVKHTNGQGTMASRMFYDPSVSGVTFELSEFRLYDGNPNEDSEASHVEGMPDACAALLEQINSGRAKLVDGTATESDITSLKEAMAALSALYVNRDSLDKALADAIAEAQAVYDEQTGSKVSILNRTDQMSTNNVDCSSSGANSVPDALSHLIDGNINTVFHSYWNRSVFSAQTVTEESYTEFLSTVNGKNGVAVNGLGYHNLQVSLDAPRDKFYFTYVGRNDARFHDNPNDIVVLATNDDALGASTLDSESSMWETVAELNENMPENVQAANYESPLIDMGTPYKYIRFVVKNITRISDRPTTEPEITGIVYNLSEFHMYAGEDPANLPYSHNADLKEAVDALKPLIDEYSGIAAHTLYNSEPIDKLKAAVAKVNSFVVDTTELINLYKTYAERIGNSVVGNEIGYVDQQSSIDDFASALIEARNSVTVPTKLAVDKAVNAMKDAYAEFLTHVTQIKANTWYTITSASTDDALIGQPIHISTKHGNDLRIGDYDIDNGDAASDPYAAWMFVPAEDTVGCYYIQNLGTGQYVGAYKNSGSKMQLQNVPTAYRLIYFGDGGFRITQANNPDDNLALKIDKSNDVLLTYPDNSDNQQVFVFEEMTAGNDMYLTDFKNNSIQIVTLPYEAKGDNAISKLNEGVAETYAVKYVKSSESGSRLGLVKITDVEAGVPFVLVVGDCKQPQSSDSVSLHLVVPETAVDSATTNGSLVGTLVDITVQKQGLGMFLNNGLYSTTSLATPFAARSGYINPALASGVEDAADLVIETEDILNGISTPVAADRTSGKVNVYTIEGTLIMKGVDANEAISTLKKGLYIIGHKKVLVK